MTEKHLSSQFDSELNSISSRVMELGGLVESQIQQAIYALSHFSLEAVQRVDEAEKRVNQLEVDIDYELSTIIARRQPTARDLRLLIAFSKATANLERMGDEAHKMARMVGSIIESGAATHRVTYQGELLKLGPTEFKLLHYLMKHAERVHSRSQLLDKVWGDHVFIEERTVDVHVKRLREALGAANVMVETVRGAGYRITAQPQALQRA